MAETKPKHKIRIIRNAARCNHCGDVIESAYRHDFKTCSCGHVSVDGGHDYLRRCYASPARGPAKYGPPPQWAQFSKRAECLQVFSFSVLL